MTTITSLLLTTCNRQDLPKYVQDSFNDFTGFYDGVYNKEVQWGSKYQISPLFEW